MAAIATPPPGPGKPLLSLQSRLILSHIRRNRFISVGTVVILTCLISAGFIEIYLNYFLPVPAHVVFETATSYSNTDVNLSGNSNSNSKNQKNMNTQTDGDNLINLTVTDDHLITPPQPQPQRPILSTTSTDTQTPPLAVQQNSTATQTEAEDEEDEELLLLLTEQPEESPAADVANVLENNDNDTEVEIDVPDFVDLSGLITVNAETTAPAAVTENVNVVEVKVMGEVQTLIYLCGANETTFTLDHIPVKNGKEVEEITLQGLFINFTLDFHSISNADWKELTRWFYDLFSLAHMYHLFFIGPDRLASFIKRIERFTDAATTVDLIFLNDTIDYWNSYVFELRHLISFQSYLQAYYSFTGDPIISNSTVFKTVSFTDWSRTDSIIYLVGVGEGGVRKVPLLSFNIIETESSSSNELLLLNYLNRLKGVVKGFISELPADIQPVLFSDNIDLNRPLFKNSPLIHLIFYISLYNNLIQSTSLTVLKRFFSLG